MITACENFDLLIDRGPAGYQARVLRSLAGDAAVDFTLSLPTEVVQPIADGQAGTVEIVQFGARLYEAAFGDAVGVCLLRSLDEAQRRGVGLRIRLRIDGGLPELGGLPWEYLYAPALHRFLALSDQTPVVRYLETAQPVLPLQTQPPLSVLAVLASPTDLPPLAVEAEWQRLQAALTDLAGRQAVSLERLQQPTVDALQARLRRGPVHVLHFVGHGSPAGDAGGEGGLVFENDRRRSQSVPASALALLLHDHAPLRLAFLNACQGAAGGRSDPFAGVAQRLVQQGLPAVVAMQFPVSDAAGLALAHEFYRALADGCAVDTALTEARKAIAAAGNETEWGTPVLFSRSDDNRLIELPQGDARPTIEIRPFEPETVLIPAGPFLMGSQPAAGIPPSETPQHTVTLPAFRIGRFPVTHRQYAEFIRHVKEQEVPKDAGWFNREPPADRLDYAVTGVSWFDALAYCRWLSSQTGRRYTLPTEAQWEKAARGTDGRAFPWGDHWEAERCAAGAADPGLVTAFPAGSSPFGCEAMIGHVQQWTRTLWGRQPQQPDTLYPYRADDGREVAGPEELPAQSRLVHRGGSFKSASADLRCAQRGHALPESRIAWRGFRVAMEL